MNFWFLFLWKMWILTRCIKHIKCDFDCKCIHTCKLQFLLLWQAMRWICQNNISSNKYRVTPDSYQNSRNALSLLFCFVNSLNSELQSNVKNLKKDLLTMCTAVLAVSALLRDYWIAFSTQTLHFPNFNHVNSFHCWFGKVPDFLQFMTPLSLNPNSCSGIGFLAKFC